MRKPFKVMTTTSMIAALAASSMVPVAVSAADENATATAIETAIFSYDNEEFLEVSFTDYRRAMGADAVESEGLIYITGDNGKLYSFTDYRRAMGVVQDVEEAFKLIKPIENVELKPGKIDTDLKKVVAADEQPEDRLNETFFYNVA